MSDILADLPKLFASEHLRIPQIDRLRAWKLMLNASLISYQVKIRDVANGWQKHDPIVLEDGTTLKTLQQAVSYLAKTVPAVEQDHPTV